MTDSHTPPLPQDSEELVPPTGEGPSIASNVSTPAFLGWRTSASLFGSLLVYQWIRERRARAPTAPSVPADSIISALLSFAYWSATWLVFCMSIMAAISFLVDAVSQDSSEQRRESCRWVGGSLAVAVLFWFFLIPASQSVKRLKLPANASAEEIVSAYEPKVYFIAVNYSGKFRQQGFWGTSFVESKAACSGSGILVANDACHGLLVTNRHVVDPCYGVPDARILNVQIIVKSPLDSKFIPAKVMAFHPQYDMALLLIDGQFGGNEAVRIAGRVRQGEEAVAIGNPQGIEFIASNGIISGRDGDMIGATCAISGGSSGGPLILGRHGLLAGLNTYSRVGDRIAQNLNFAVPATAVVDGRLAPFDISSTSDFGTWGKWRLKNEAYEEDWKILQRLVAQIDVVND